MNQLECVLQPGGEPGDFTVTWHYPGTWQVWGGCWREVGMTGGAEWGRNTSYTSSVVLPASISPVHGSAALSVHCLFVSLGHAFLCFGQCLIFQGAYLSSSSTPTLSWLHFALLLARSQTLRLPSGTELIATEGGLPEKDCRVSLDEAGIPEGPGAWGFGSQGS